MCHWARLLKTFTKLCPYLVQENKSAKELEDQTKILKETLDAVKDLTKVLKDSLKAVDVPPTPTTPAPTMGTPGPTMDAPGPTMGMPPPMGAPAPTMGVPPPGMGPPAPMVNAPSLQEWVMPPMGAQCQWTMPKAPAKSTSMGAAVPGMTGPTVTTGMPMLRACKQFAKWSNSSGWCPCGRGIDASFRRWHGTYTINLPSPMVCLLAIPVPDRRQPLLVQAESESWGLRAISPTGYREEHIRGFAASYAPRGM